MRSQSKAVCWRAASWTCVCLLSLGFIVSVIAGA